MNTCLALIRKTLDRFAQTQLGKRFVGIYDRHLRSSMESFYFKHLKYNPYYQESVFLLLATPGWLKKQYEKAKLAIDAKASKRQQRWALVLVLAWITFKLTIASYDFWQAVSAPKVKLGPNDELIITPGQVKQVAPGPVIERDFAQNSAAIGNIDFDQDHSVAVFTPYQGRIGKVLVAAGDEVKAGQVVYTVLVPDMAQAASALVASAGVLKMNNETLRRAKSLYESRSISLKELEQNISDQQTAEGNYKAALKTMALFGLSDEQIKQILAGRKIDTEMPVLSPVTGRVVARSAAPGLLVQPGNAPAPVTVSDTTHLWMVASIPESDIGQYHIGQLVHVRVQAFPNKTYSGTIFYVGDASDPNTHRIPIKAAVVDENHELRPQMLADFTIVLREPILGVAVPAKALVREPDGTFTVWITSKNSSAFYKRTVQVGLMQEEYVQILDGLKVGELVAQSNALFLSNLFATLH